MSSPTRHSPDITLSKVLAGAGAAVTSAVIGSFFGVAGTIVGAAVGSVASTVATALYELSLNRTREQILARLRAREAAGGPDGAEDDVDGPTPDGPGPRRPNWMLLAGVTVLVFLLGMLALTGYEWVKGSTVAGEPGTSVGRVIEPAPTTAEPSTTDSPSDSSSASADATSAPSTRSSRDRSPASASAEPTATPTPSVTPTPSPASIPGAVAGHAG